MKLGIVIGNGQSRKAFDLKQIPEGTLVYGCNALYRDYSPSVLFARDEGMIQEISENYKGPVAKQLKRRLIKEGKKTYYADPVISYEDVSGKHEIEVPKSIAFTGGVATYCMCTVHKPDKIYLMGFAENTNAYTGTPNYSDQSITNEAFIKELGMIFNKFPEISFYRVANTALPDTGLRWEVVTFEEMLRDCNNK